MSEFVEVKTAELTGAALDWAVAKVDGDKRLQTTRKQFGLNVPVRVVPSYSTYWNHIGPLIEKHIVDITVERKGLFYASVCDDSGMPVMPGDVNGAFGPTHLIAACRAIVASVLGETVSAPKDLV